MCDGLKLNSLVCTETPSGDSGTWELLLASSVCLLHLLICTCLNSLTTACHHHPFYVDVYCVCIMCFFYLHGQFCIFISDYFLSAFKPLVCMCFLFVAFICVLCPFCIYFVFWIYGFWICGYAYVSESPTLTFYVTAYISFAQKLL